ncbi:hypothetical protein NC652_000293 [Populus alba x Populus x berolinensis]|nr:hypothetical protein NC652_000293 [Populus alba x Populus x berolinensis]
MSGLSLAKKRRLPERWNGDQRESEKKGAELAGKGGESVRLKGEGKLVCRGKVLVEERGSDDCERESAGSQSLLGKAPTKEEGRRLCVRI